MQWSEFHPYVLPYVLGCPDPVVDHHARLTAIDFCRRTLCWQVTLAPVLTGGTAQVALTPGEGRQIVKIKSVVVAGKTWPVLDASSGMVLSRDGSTQDFCFTQDNLTLHIYPVQATGVEVVADVALAPSASAATLDDALGLPYLQDLSAGVVASIQRIPGQLFSDLNSSMLMRQQFEARMVTVAAKVSRGLLGSKIRSRTSYL